MRKLSLLLAVTMLLLVALMPVQAQNGTIADIAASNENFSILLKAVQAADPAILEALSGPGPLTVFAPTDAAFGKFASYLGIDLNDLLANKTLVTRLLQYHVIQGSVLSTDALGLDGQTVPTLLPGTALGITVQDGNIIINGIAQVVEPFDVIATNGVVHAIEDVIFPGLLRADLEALGAPPAMTYIRVLHAAGDARTVDIWANDTVVASRMTLGDLTGWLEVPAGTYDITVTPTGLPLSAEVVTQEATDDAAEVVETVSNAIIGPISLELAADNYYTIVANGLRAADSLTATVVTGDLIPIADNEARVTVFHAIPDAPAVDILVNGEAVISGLAFGESESITVRANTYDLAVVPSGATEPIVIDLSNTTLRSNRFYFVAAIGSISNPDVVVTSTAASDVKFPVVAEEGE